MSPRLQRNKGNLVVGLDCSTTAVKAIVFDDRGAVIAKASEPIPLYSPRPNYFEQDPGDWWHSASRALRNITRQVSPQRIIALGVSNQRETFVPLDEKGNALRPAIVWLDERCKDEVGAFAKKIGEKRIHRITGKPPDYAPVVYRLAWMKRHEADLFKKIRMISDVHAYVTWKLTGTFRTSWASADPTGLLDTERKRWAPTILDALGLAVDQLPAAYCPGSLLGLTTRDASRLTGLSKFTPVIAGGGDGQAAGLGANALSPERAYLNLGTAVVAGVYGTDYKTSKAFRTMMSCSGYGYYYECSLRAGTFTVDWLIKNVLGIDPARSPGIYGKLEWEARQVPAGCNGLMHLPYLCGVMNPYWDMNAKGAFVGLSSAHRRGHLYRSILEGIAFEQSLAIGAVEKAVGKRVRGLAAIGGGASNALWLQIFADITGKRISIPSTTEASALGAAIAAAVGAGLYKSFREAATQMTRMARTIKPIRKNQATYRRLSERYARIYPGLK